MLRLAVALAFLVAAASAASLSPPVWPSQWNATWNFVNTTNGAMIDGPNNWWYDAVHNMLRQDNHYRCNYPKYGIPCSAVFRGGNVRGNTASYSSVKMYYNIPAANFCCLCWTNLGITGVHWLANATFAGQTTYNLTNEAANLWTFPFEGQLQYYYETAANRLPLALSGYGTDQQWVDIILGPQNPFVFSLPSTCNQRCPSASFQECGNNEKLDKHLARFVRPIDD